MDEPHMYYCSLFDSCITLTELIPIMVILFFGLLINVNYCFKFILIYKFIAEKFFIFYTVSDSHPFESMDLT